MKSEFGYFAFRILSGQRVDMRSACVYVLSMPKMIQVRDVPEEIHAVLKSRAALAGMSLSGFLNRELAKLASQPSLREWLESSRQLRLINGSQSVTEVIRQMRDSLT